MNGNGLGRPLTVITSYKQSEQIYSDGVRRIRPVWLRPTHPYKFCLLPDVPQMGYKTYVKINREVTALQMCYFGHICRRRRSSATKRWTRDEVTVRMISTIRRNHLFTAITIGSPALVNHISEDNRDNGVNEDAVDTHESVEMDGNGLQDLDADSVEGSDATSHMKSDVMDGEDLDAVSSDSLDITRREPCDAMDAVSTEGSGTASNDGSDLTGFEILDEIDDQNLDAISDEDLVAGSDDGLDVVSDESLDAVSNDSSGVASDDGSDTTGHEPRVLNGQDLDPISDGEWE